MADNCRTDEAGAAGDEDFHFGCPCRGADCCASMFCDDRIGCRIPLNPPFKKGGRKSALPLPSLEGRPGGMLALIIPSISRTLSCTSSASPRDSTFRRSKGSVFELRRLKRQSCERYAQPVGKVQLGAIVGEMLFDRLNDRLCIGYGVIQLATAGECGDALIHQTRQRQALDAQQFGYQQPGNHAAVTKSEIAEIVMRTHLAAVHRVLGAHALLDERVAGFALHWYATGA